METEARVSFVKQLREIAQQDGRYKVDAYLFLFEALSFAQSRFQKKRHVSGQELLEGIRELALGRFGPMSKSVFEHWGVTTTDDFGGMVFLLVKNDMLSKTDSDNIESFHDVYSFDDVFIKDYRYGSKV